MKLCKFPTGRNIVHNTKYFTKTIESPILSFAIVQVCNILYNYKELLLAEWLACSRASLQIPCFDNCCTRLLKWRRQKSRYRIELFGVLTNISSEPISSRHFFLQKSYTYNTNSNIFWKKICVFINWKYN